MYVCVCVGVCVCVCGLQVDGPHKLVSALRRLELAQHRPERDLQVNRTAHNSEITQKKNKCARKNICSTRMESQNQKKKRNPQNIDSLHLKIPFFANTVAKQRYPKNKKKKLIKAMRQ
jgi:hypothetical protein